MNASVTPQSQNHVSSSSLFFIQLFATMAFAVLYATLVLYTTKKLHFTESSANALMGVFGAFNYGLHLFGGYLGGRYLSNRTLFILGMILQVAGCYFLSSASLDGLYWGLAMFLTGSGLNVTCINMMLTQRFSPEDNRRESAFLWNYAGMNLGFFIGFSISGYFQLSENYHQLFLLTTLGNIFAVILTLVFWKQLKDISTPLTEQNNKEKNKRFILGILTLVVLVPIVYKMLTLTNLTSYLVILLGTIIFVLLCLLTYRHQDNAEKAKMAAYLLLMTGALVFWSLYQLAPMGLTLFAEHNLNLNLMGYTIAPQWLQNINTIVIVIGGPLLAWYFNRLRKKGLRFDIPLQFSCSLLFIGFGMLVLPLGINVADTDGKVGVQWMILSYILQSIGELLISPIGYAMIGKLAPKKYQGIMMGSWMMVTGVASVLASYVSGMMPQDSAAPALMTNPGFSHIFVLLGWGAVLAAVLLSCFIPLLRKLITPPNAA